MSGYHPMHADRSNCVAVPGASNLPCDTSATPRQLSDAASDREINVETESQTPYTTGFTFTAWRHCPSAPFGYGYDTPLPAQHSDPAAVSHEELCTSRQPLKGQTQHEFEKTFTITSTLRTGVDRGPQLVVVNDAMVAKIYDPLFYKPDKHTDVFWNADKAYCSEAAAYQHLQESTAVSDIVPVYYGSWTFDIETIVIHDGVSKIKTRPIRMILIEYVQGHCMVAVDPYSIPESTRTLILKQCIDAEILLNHAGVNHGDLSPRNIIVLGLGPDSSDIRVKIIDFDIALVLNHPNVSYRAYHESRKQKWSQQWSDKLTSPIVRFFRNLAAFSCEGWCPNEDGGSDQWLWQNYAEDDRYATVQWDQNEKFARPTYADPGAKMERPVGNVATSQSGSEIATSSSGSNTSNGSNASNEINGSIEK
jgi:serine/threonine protein kinase